MNLNKQINSLNSLKGIFIFMIVLFHIHAMFGDVFSTLFGFFYQYGGQIGNSFFFVVSGFTISFGYKAKIIKGEFTLFTFIKNRIRKLYPIFLCSTVVQLLLGIRSWGGDLNFKSLTLNLLLITSGWADDIKPFNTPCWFLSQLLLCYIIYYVITQFFKEKSSHYFYVLLIFWGYILQNKGWNFPFCYTHDGEGFMNFFIGCLMFEVYKRYTKRQMKMICNFGFFVILMLIAGGGNSRI